VRKSLAAGQAVVYENFAQAQLDN